jgi:long-subunit acyl-CoA synthetase (AMP-forming)
MAIPVTDPVVPTVENLPTMIAEAAVAPGAAMRFRRDGRWQRMSYADVFTRAAKIASGLIALGVRPGERVAILGATTPDWTLCDLGALCAGAVVVPIYHTNSPGECAHVLANSGARAVIVEDAGQLAKISAVRDQCPELEHAILMRSDTPSAVTITLSDLEALGADVSAARLASATAGVGPGDPATIVYTSGTTGPAKGCVLTHANILSTAAMYEDQLRLAGDGSPVVFMFLPLAHVLARVVQFVTFKVGGELAFGAATRARCSLTSKTSGRRTSRPSHASSKSSTQPRSRARSPVTGCTARCSAGRSPSAAAYGPPSGRPGGPGSAIGRSTRSPTRWCCARSAPCSADGSSARSPAPPPSGGRCSSSSTPAASRSSRATA